MIILSIIVGLLIAAITCWYLKVLKVRSALQWIPEAPRSSILGNTDELQNPHDVLKVFLKYANQYDGLNTVELATYKFIIASNPKFLEFLLGKMDILNKSDEYKFLDSWLGTGLLTTDGPKWKKTRKLLTPSFHFSSLETFMDIFENNGDILVELLEKETKNDSFNIVPYCTNTALDAICEAAMGVSINAQRNTTSDYPQAVAEKCKLLIDRTYSPLKTFSLLYRLTPDYYKNKACDEIIHSHTLNVIRSRIKELKAEKTEAKRNDEDFGIKTKKVFLDLLLEATLDGKPLTEKEIREEVDTFMFAGHDTTATALSFCLYAISTHQDVQEKIINEQKQIFGKDWNRRATYRDLQEMKYLELVIKEGLRLYPSVPYVGRKTDKDVKYIDGNVIPKGTGILVVIFCVNRNPKYFPDPERFDPSRFEDAASIPPYTYLPFSAGPRNCIGQKFAWNIMKSVISKVVRNYELLPCGHELILAAKTVLVSENGIRLKIRKRNWY